MGKQNENGYILILVLVFVALGGLLITPMLTLASTSLDSVRNSVERSKSFYAADNGVEIAKNYINDGIEYGNFSLTSNDCDVDVSISKYVNDRDFIGIVAGENMGQIYNAKHPHSDSTLLNVDRIVNGNNITITINNVGSKKSDVIRSIGIWIYGNAIYNNVASGFTIEPEILNVSLGTSFIWKTNFILNAGESKSFTVGFSNISSELIVSWAKCSSDVWIVPDSDYGLCVYNIKSVASGDKITSINSYVIKKNGILTTLSFAY